MKQKNNHSNLLALLKILYQYTDQKHPLSMQEILSYMNEMDHECSDETILKYMKQLIYELDINLHRGRGRNAKYFIAEREITKEELTLLIDAVNASNFVEKTIAEQLNKKLKKMCSCYEAMELERNVLGISTTKAENTKILKLVNMIQEALKCKVQIKFDYMKWNKEKKLVKGQEKRYSINPWGLIWANERYYLYGYDVEERNGKLQSRCYRVDKLSAMELTDIRRKGEEEFHQFDASTYVARRVGMFNGVERLISVKVNEHLVGAFIDQFGKNIMMQKVEEVDEQSIVTITFMAADTNLLLGWLIGLGNVEVIKPEETRKRMELLLKENLGYYELKE
ncbi:MAG: WYL domain-containing protein [Eubacteriales bacterium]